MNKIKSRRAVLSAIMVGSLAMVAACSGKNEAPSAAKSSDAPKKSDSKPASEAKSPYSEAEQAYGLAAGTVKGIEVGSSKNVAYVLFDPNCPHCAKLWSEAKLLKDKVKFVWAPVSILPNTMPAIGATILAAKDPIKAMDKHITDRITLEEAGSAPSDLTRSVERNSHVFQLMQAEGVPLVLYRNAETGKAEMATGAMTAADLAKKMGLPAPK